MEIYIDKKKVYELTPIKHQILEYDIPKELMEEEIHRRVCWAIDVKLEACWEDMKKEWMPLLEERYPSLPTNREELCKLIISQPDYQSRDHKEAKLPEEERWMPTQNMSGR